MHFGDPTESIWINRTFPDQISRLPHTHNHNHKSYLHPSPHLHTPPTSPAQQFPQTPASDLSTTSTPMLPPADSPAKMFHTFQGLAPQQKQTSVQSQESPKSTTNGTSKRVTTPHACAECKRRKIRCDGRQPCGQCLGCRSPKPCYYDKHRQRVIPSRKTLDALSQSLEECRTILKRLYPNRDPQSLLPLSRQELVVLLDKPASISIPSQTSPAGSNASHVSPGQFQSPITSISDDDRSLANLEQIPSRDTEWDEERRNRDPIPAEADDVNALSLSVDRQSSYLGATSIKAAFLVMLKVAPALRSFLAPQTSSAKINIASNYPTPRPGHSVPVKSLPRVAWSSEGQTLIDAYFNRVQMLIPMLDEPSFRADYLNGQRTDAPWLALLNMVFAMGSIVANKSDDHNHLNFYNQAKEYLPLDSFGSGHLETLQAFALMGGYYLHYLNRPNMANAISGAALRMACAMGIHRESADQTEANPVAVELRRRTWWSLFCLDTWAATTLGRPSMGRWGPAITIRPPECTNDPNATAQHAGIIPLVENIKFCKIATQIQEILAQSPLLHDSDRIHLDNQLVAWYDHLPWILRSTEPCPESLYTARCVMKWRYQNLRVVLHRPVLLNMANRGIQSGPPSPEEIAAVGKCREIAKQTIEDISREFTPNQMLGWNGVWFMYQASMIPLVSVFWENWNTALVRECQSQIEMVLDSMDTMADWSVAARRSREVVLKMYEASKRPLVSRQGTPGLVMNGMNGMQTGSQEEMVQVEMEDGMILLDHQNFWDLDGMPWGNFPEGLDLGFEGIPGFEYADPSGGTGGFMGNEMDYSDGNGGFGRQY